MVSLRRFSVTRPWIRLRCMCYFAYADDMFSAIKKTTKVRIIVCVTKLFNITSELHQNSLNKQQRLPQLYSVMIVCTAAQAVTTAICVFCFHLPASTDWHLTRQEASLILIVTLDKRKCRSWVRILISVYVVCDSAPLRRVIFRQSYTNREFFYVEVSDPS